MRTNEKDLVFLEKWGINMLQFFSKKTGIAKNDGQVHILSPVELLKLKSIQNFAVFRAAIAGSISAGICVIVGLLTANLFDSQLVKYLLINGVVLLVCTFFEFYFLFWDALRTTNRICHEAGLEIPEDHYSDLSLFMSRAALEIPNPSEPILGVNPLKYASKTQLFFNSAFYKGKIVLTNQIIKWFFIRIFGKLSYFDFFAIPVTAFWDAWICRKILQESRIRAVGPSAIQERIIQYFPEPEVIPEHAKLVFMRAIAAAVTQSGDFHPNLLLFYQSTLNRLMPDIEEDIHSFAIDDTEIFIKEFNQLEHIHQITTIRILLFAIIIDGVAHKKELFLLKKLCDIKNIQLKLSDVQMLVTKIKNGRPFSISHYVKN